MILLFQICHFGFSNYLRAFICKIFIKTTELHSRTIQIRRFKIPRIVLRGNKTLQFQIRLEIFSSNQSDPPLCKTCSERKCATPSSSLDKQMLSHCDITDKRAFDTATEYPAAFSIDKSLRLSPNAMIS